ncbi:DUF2309 domain-containing protein [Haloarcula argentinensis]|uniref:Probable inorganic carbon transporter subunit DabA n=1 Tax=Haloarcula argentinensis TaxID=43776 RepID=A0ABU2F5X4_HALAR|nr:DUF2309 domain-containing protein [Haloarcula argentinensis]EMA26374.1 hypothetical protein C443_01462 [Haloarcula argentinensis DSM 12282]MDS0255555.1 DUF2309 domain-containing protein [Haloarcula argentinensis]
MSTESTIHDSIDTAATTVGSIWPIHSFVTANPLAGFEDQPFSEAVTQAADLLGGRGYPSAETFRAALERGQINPEILDAELSEAGYENDPETLLDRMGEVTDAPDSDPDTATDRVDQVLTKWLSAFLDEGSAHWSMPNREAGFYTAFRGVAAHDGDIPDDGLITDLPETPTEAIETVLASYPESQWVPIFEEQLAALPGWTGLIKQRADDESAWQSAYPISLDGYLAARLALLDAVGADIAPSNGSIDPDPTAELAGAFLRAWEASYRDDLVETIASESQSHTAGDSPGRPDAQLVFCIDTRSEIIRRHIEAAGDYETHGYAGFFGIPMEYQGYDADVSVDACPPILDPQHHVTDVPTDDDTRENHDRLWSIRETADEIIETLEANAATAYGFVETAGSGYGLALAARTLVPGRVRDLFNAADSSAPDEHEFCEPLVHHQHTYTGDLPVGLTTDEKVEYAATAFDLMGWETFSRLVVFTGHASETTNNPYDSSLDCGACAGNPGGPNARVLAAICNDTEVRAALRDRGFEIPDDTVFLAGEHNTTTDEVELYDSDVPESHAADLDQLRADLATARENAAAERAESMGGDASSGVSETERRAADWAETRPEWGLAGNAGFVIGPRELTSGVDLDGRAFLHSYDWSTDPDGEALEAILTGPMVVTQWINTQYYFSMVDNAVYGSGSKVTHNPVGNVGVYQGNGGDLMTGLPLQSLMAADDDPYHQPLRLSTVIHAPVDRVTDVLADHPELANLLDNNWLSLTVIDPTQDHSAFEYEQDLEWSPVSELSETDLADPTAPAVSDD